MTMTGGRRTQQRLSSLRRHLLEELEKVNEKSGKEMVRLAKVLIPTNSGASRQAITGQAVEGGYLVDAGPHSKVIEGDNAPRPFFNPALKLIAKKHRNAARRAMRKAVKEQFGG